MSQVLLQQNCNPIQNAKWSWFTTLGKFPVNAIVIYDCRVFIRKATDRLKVVIFFSDAFFKKHNFRLNNIALNFSSFYWALFGWHSREQRSIFKSHQQMGHFWMDWSAMLLAFVRKHHRTGQHKAGVPS